MKINPYTDRVSCPLRAASASQPGTTGMPEAGSYDTITVGAKTPSTESTFFDLLASRLSMEVRHTAPPEKLDRLSRQVAEGSYQPDEDRIADSIMLLKTL